MKDTYKITGEYLVERQKDLFPNTYLTLVAIIQGLALSLLVHEFHENVTILSLLMFLQYLLCFSVIVVVWHEYHWAAFLFAWMPKIPDSLIPFSIGVVEAILIYSVGNNENNTLFFFSFFLITSAGAIGYHNTNSHYSEENFSKELLDFGLFNQCKRMSDFAIGILKKAAIISLLLLIGNVAFELFNDSILIYLPISYYFYVIVRLFLNSKSTFNNLKLWLYDNYMK